MPRSKQRIDESRLTKGEVRKLNALRKSVGLQIADEAFVAWYQSKSSTPQAEPQDPNIDTIEKALGSVIDRLHFPRGSAYQIRRGRGRIIVERAERQNTI